MFEGVLFVACVTGEFHALETEDYHFFNGMAILVAAALLSGGHGSPARAPLGRAMARRRGTA